MLHQQNISNPIFYGEGLLAPTPLPLQAGVPHLVAYSMHLQLPPMLGMSP
jgi:hypothetical protein